MSTRPIIITVHGTFAGVPNELAPRWWQTSSALAVDLGARFGPDGFELEPFIWGDGERTGPNRESERRRAGEKLLDRLLQLEAEDRPYHLIGHSHGGSVIWHALKASSARNRQLENLKSWISVSTPFLDFGPDWPAWRRLGAALAVAIALHWIGLWNLLTSMAAGTRERGIAGLISNLPLIGELSDIRVALGELVFFCGIGVVAAISVAFTVLLLRPLADLRWHLIEKWRRLLQEKLAAQRYGPLWLGLAHPQDEAINGLKATLTPAPALVLRRRSGWTGLLDRAINPFTAAIDQFAWSVLMRKSQGCDLQNTALRRAGATPLPLEGALCPLPPDVASRIQKRADEAAAQVLVKFRNRLDALSDQDDFDALGGLMSGAYDDASLIHTTMFEEPWVRSAIVDRMASGGTACIEQGRAASGSRLAKMPMALSFAKTLVAVSAVVVVTVLANAGYRLYVEGETNRAAAERIAARFGESSFQVIKEGRIAGDALVRAYRLGLPLDQVFQAAGKLRDEPTKSVAYQLVMREMAARGRTAELVGWVIMPTGPAPSISGNLSRHRHIDHMAVGLVAALEVLANDSHVPPDVLATLYQAAIIQADGLRKGEHQTHVYQRLIPIAVALKQWDQAVVWAGSAARIDPDCLTWDALVADTARVVADQAGIAALERIIAACNPTANSDDHFRSLRVVAIERLRSCDLAEQLLPGATSFGAPGRAQISTRVVECLASLRRRSDAEKLALAVDVPVTERDSLDSERLDEVWSTTESFRKVALSRAADRLSAIAVRLADEATSAEQLEQDIDRAFAFDASRLRVLRAASPVKHATLLRQISDNAKAFETSRSFSASLAMLRDIHARHVELALGKPCSVSAADASAIVAVVQIAGYYSDKNPWSVALSALRIIDLCAMPFGNTTFDIFASVVSGNSNDVERAEALARLAPYRATLRGSLATADQAGSPLAILKGYAASIDRLRPSLRPVQELPFTPLGYELVTANTRMPQ